jgi:PAS domain S-box-containing protein
MPFDNARPVSPSPQGRSEASTRLDVEASTEIPTHVEDRVATAIDRSHVAHATRLLVADDNADTRAYLQRLLRPLGTVEAVADGQEALAAIERRMPDLVLSDVMMPRLDALMRALREDPRTRTVPIVLLSARAGDESRFEDAGPGASDYIVKPFSARELVARVRAQLQLAHQRREHEKALVQSEERYRDLIRHAPAGIYEIDFRARRFVSVNDAMCEMLGYSRDELVEMDPSGIMDEESRARFQERVRRWLGGEELERSVEYRVRARDGRIFDAVLDVTFTRDADGQPQGATVIAHDITARKQAEEALRESEELLRAVTDNSPDAIYVKDRASRWLMANPAVLRIVGRTAEQALGKTDLELYDDPAVGATILENDRRIMENGRTEAFEEVADTPDGRRTFVSVKAPRRDSQGNVVGLIGISRDITERKRAEEDLRRANFALAEADRRKDEFLAMLAHELRNPLSVIGGASEILQRPGGMEPEVQRAREAIERQARHMARLVDDLLDVSRVTQGKIALKNERVPLADVLRHAAEATAPTVRALGHRLFVSLPPDLLFVDGDAVRLTQIVSNVLNNAVKYTPAGGEIHLSAERHGGQVEIRVRDNGQGIKAALLPHVFDLFVQGDRGADRAQGGLGIGLTMARSLVAMHGGTIEAHSDGPGAGSEFVIALPLAQAEPAPGTADDRRLPRGVSRRILVADDNTDAVEMMRTLLELDGHQVTAVHDGLAAIRCVMTWRPDVALIDLGMPGIDGFEVARQVRADPSMDRTVLVALTGYGQEEDVRRSRDAGFDHHVTKSADFEPLRRLLDSIPGAPEP